MISSDNSICADDCTAYPRAHDRPGNRMGGSPRPGPRRTEMFLTRRRFLQLAAGATALPALSGTAQAQPYPARPVRIIAGFPAGGGIDLVARLIGQWLSERFGKPFITE